jgi:hypothetical protein
VGCCADGAGTAPAESPPVLRGRREVSAGQHFAIGFYGGLGERESVAAAYAQGSAAIRLQGLADRPKLAVRAGIDAGKLVLAADPVERSKTDPLD